MYNLPLFVKRKIEEKYNISVDITDSIYDIQTSGSPPDLFVTFEKIVWEFVCYPSDGAITQIAEYLFKEYKKSILTNPQTRIKIYYNALSHEGYVTMRYLVG